MPIAPLPDLNVHYKITGHGAPVVFCNSLGTDMRLWDDIIPLLPKNLQYIQYDKRGHGLTDAPPAPYSMGALIGDAERLLDHLNIQDCVFVGCSIGGMIGQGLAVKRMDQVRALVLSNTAARIGTPQMWAERIEKVTKGGVDAVADGVIERWFSKSFRATPEVVKWRNMLIRTPQQGYAGCSAAISGSDFLTTTATLTLPTLAIAGSEDGSTPPDMVRETAGLINGARFHLIRGAGHLPSVEKPQEFAATLTEFLNEIGHGSA
ncbi:3-oxoadipate enol-lactonase [Oceaniglobus ichthyenteri]|uniref:3-oxoadipate enol-lactonase n=1 Tax=Oceaniglobus ichthyenteri TaxID=2136177 RepID=UPI000D3C3103|nr:3-oxoadipate enol-lactonase [Oceaniglobus ichthyenteri]